MERPFKYSVSNWVAKLDKAFPLPEAPSEMCRDAFLQELIHSIIGTPESVESEDSIISSGPRVKFNNKYSARSDVISPETQIMRNYVLAMDDSSIPGIMYARLSRVSKVSKMSTITKKSDIIDINRLLNNRYQNISSAIGFVSVLYQLRECNNRMKILREMWHTTVTAKNSLRIFSWSINDYFKRFNLPNHLYLDEVELDLKNEIECYKFRVDLHEISRLLEALYDDVSFKRNICNSSMLLIQDAETDIKQLLMSSQKAAEEHHHDITLLSYQTPRSADPDRSRTKAIQSKVNYADFISPIEERYRINWAQTTMEQSIIFDGATVKKMSADLKHFKEETIQVTHLWELSSMAYDLEILGLKKRISDMESKYIENLEYMDNTIQMTRNKLAKAKDDLKFYKDQIPIFHEKIAAVKEIRDQQEAIDNRRSKKSSHHSTTKPLIKKK